MPDETQQPRLPEPLTPDEKIAMPDSSTPLDLETFASQVAHHLPGPWETTVHRGNNSARPLVARHAWDDVQRGHYGDASPNGQAATLHGPAGEELLLGPDPRRPRRRLIGPLFPAGVAPWQRHRHPALRAIQAHPDPARTASAVARRLLPPYRQARLALSAGRQSALAAPADDPDLAFSLIPHFEGTIAGAFSDSLDEAAHPLHRFADTTLQNHGFAYYTDLDLYVLDGCLPGEEQMEKVATVITTLQSAGLTVAADPRILVTIFVNSICVKRFENERRGKRYAQWGHE
jgi:hypothetical protein